MSIIQLRLNKELDIKDHIDLILITIDELFNNIDIEYPPKIYQYTKLVFNM